MSSLIEQAAERLRQLKQAGVDVSGLSEVNASTALPAAEPQPVVAARSTAPVAVAGDGGDADGLSRRVGAHQIELNLDALAQAGLVTPGGMRSELADQFRIIKRPVIANAAGKGAASLVHGNLVMITSALPGEGKSFTALNLAMSIADELDHTVMLVDADVARPSLPAMLGFRAERGLLDVLLGEADVPDVLLRTNVPKLTILPAGPVHPKSTELLASQAMKTLLHDIAMRYHDRIVIFDSPPLLLTTESRVLASHMGQVVLVVHADKTLQSDVETAISCIQNCPVKMVLLNQARSDVLGRYVYGYGHGYGYGRRGRYPPRDAKGGQESLGAAEARPA